MKRRDLQELSVRNVDRLNRLKVRTVERNWCRWLAVGDETGSGTMARGAARFASPPGLCH